MNANGVVFILEDDADIHSEESKIQQVVNILDDTDTSTSSYDRQLSDCHCDYKLQVSDLKAGRTRDRAYF